MWAIRTTDAILAHIFTWRYQTGQHRNVDELLAAKRIIDQLIAIAADGKMVDDR